ncbi:MAG: DNA repair protein RadC [Muribaculaceae bacterium]|nr:DNA repair protein RadC [Muribaculaceae bacterium]
MPDIPKRTMKDFDPSEQPREKAARYGCSVLSTAELLALILRTGVTGVPIIEMTRRLLDDNGGSLHTLQRRTQKEIMMTPGMGEIKSMQVMAIMELARRYFEEESDNTPKVIKNSRDIHNLMRFDIANANQEQIWLITLSRRNGVLARHHLTTGSAVASVFDLKRALKLALLDEASALILCHNHPSGNLIPSPQDDNITKSLRNAATSMDLRLLDHVIISAEGFYSYADEGRL